MSMFSAANLFAIATCGVLFCPVVHSASYSAAYEVWAADQSNSVADQEGLGVKGSFLWIWGSEDIQEQLQGGQDAVSLPCTPLSEKGPCDVMEMFPSTLEEYDENGKTGNTLGELPYFGRLHGVIKDPQNRYVTASFFMPDGGYIGVIDTVTKEAVALFRATQLSYARSVHMSFWSHDGTAIIVGNLHGKAAERINVERDSAGTITNLLFDKSATLGLGKSQEVTEPATVFRGKNAFGNDLIGNIIGDYANSDLGNLTPNGVCKENGCGGTEASKGGRLNNLPICTVASTDNALAYATLAGGGLFVVDTSATPMKIVGEYGNNVIYGAGCGGIQAKGKMHINSGISASGAGATQSMFAVWQFNDEHYLGKSQNPQNNPMPDLIFEDPGNTQSLGNTKGESSNDSGQLPGVTTRRDSHGVAVTIDQSYVHNGDRIQNVVEVFDVETFDRFTYDLISANGRTGFVGAPGACHYKSVDDDSSLPINDPAPDLMEMTPDGKYLMIAFRGPAPVTVSHAGQGSCPGVGVVSISPNGKHGKLIAVLRTTNTLPDKATLSFPGGIDYQGNERSDIHNAIVVRKEGDRGKNMKGKKDKKGNR